jgi:hypothetical protein
MNDYGGGGYPSIGRMERKKMNAEQEKVSVGDEDAEAAKSIDTKKSKC